MCGGLPACHCQHGVRKKAKEIVLNALIVKAKFLAPVLSERELTFTFAICYRPSVCNVRAPLRPTQAVQIFGNISTALGTLAIRGHPLKILRRSSQGNPSAGGVKDREPVNS